MYENSGLGIYAKGVKDGKVEWVIRKNLRWFGFTEMMNDKTVKKKSLGETKGPIRRGRPLGRWKERKRYT